jgi:hypothetical protein
MATAILPFAIRLWIERQGWAFASRLTCGSYSVENEEEQATAEGNETGSSES